MEIKLLSLVSVGLLCWHLLCKVWQKMFSEKMGFKKQIINYHMFLLETSVYGLKKKKKKNEQTDVTL